MNNFQKITQSPEVLGAFLASLLVADGPWDIAFERNFCAGCGQVSCDDGNRCHYEAQRNNPTWWLKLEVADDASE